VSSENLPKRAGTPLAVCPDCDGRGWKLAPVHYPPQAHCERCKGTGYVGLKEWIAEAGGVT
jgi:DnaJ-class molecular chaperone